MMENSARWLRRFCLVDGSKVLNIYPPSPADPQFPLACVDGLNKSKVHAPLMGLRDAFESMSMLLAGAG